MNLPASEHLTQAQLDAYAEGALSPEGFLTVDSHMETCETCRTRVLSVLGTPPSLLDFQIDLFLGTDLYPEEAAHLTEIETEAYLQDEMSSEDRRRTQEHLATCDACRNEVSRLEALYADMGNALQRLARLRESEAVPAPVTLSVQESPVNAAQGRSWRDALVQVRQTLLQALTPPQVAFRSEGGEMPSNVVALEMPVGTRLLTDRPAFRWVAHPEADAYDLFVYQTEPSEKRLHRIPGLTDPFWLCETPLERGKTYRWEVRAVDAAGEMVAQGPPDRQTGARFLLVEATEAESIRRRLATLATAQETAELYLELGLHDELSQLAEIDPEIRDLWERAQRSEGA